jgi:hypothetical protein
MEQTTHHEQLNSAEAFEQVVNDAVERLPSGASVVGIQVTLAYVTPEMERGAVEAVGGVIARSLVPMPVLQRLFALYATAAWKASSPQDNGGTAWHTRAAMLARGPRRRPRR